MGGQTLAESVAEEEAQVEPQRRDPQQLGKVPLDRYTTIVLSGGIDEHHGRIRFPWALKAADGSTPVKGIDVGQLAADGRLASILGFWDAPPAP